VPPIDADGDEETISRNPQAIADLQRAVEDWELKIKETIEKEDRRLRERSHLTALGETDFWALRSGTFNTLFQQLNMPNVKKIINILSNKSDTEDAYSIGSFQRENKEFGKQHAQAKDFVKFLATLDRQFKNIQKGDLKTITETMPSLLNGLKLIWTISRHINHNEDKFEDILEAISTEICQKVRDQIDIRHIFKKKPDLAISTIDAGIQCLEKWWSEFSRTRTAIESEITITRWDFPKIREIFAKPRHMSAVLKQIRDACVVQ
jgi:dynein heavy chain